MFWILYLLKLYIYIHKSYNISYNINFKIKKNTQQWYFDAIFRQEHQNMYTDLIRLNLIYSNLKLRSKCSDPYFSGWLLQKICFYFEFLVKLFEVIGDLYRIILFFQLCPPITVCPRFTRTEPLLIICHILEVVKVCPILF